MKIALSAGHTLSGKGTGAVGYINESRENRTLTDLVKKWLVNGGHSVTICNVDKADNYLQQQVSMANKASADVAVQIHFNANTTTSAPMGTETLYHSSKGKVFAERVNSKLATKFKNRGPKYRDNLYWLNNCVAPTILIETCFCDSKADTDMYNSNKDQIAKLIAEGIVGHSISGSTGGGGGSTVNPPSTGGYQVGDYEKDVIITTDVLNARAGRGTEFSIVGKFTRGQKVNVWYIGKAKDGTLWGSCSCNGKTAYICMSYTRPA